MKRELDESGYKSTKNKKEEQEKLFVTCFVPAQIESLKLDLADDQLVLICRCDIVFERVEMV